MYEHLSDEELESMLLAEGSSPWEGAEEPGNLLDAQEFADDINEMFPVENETPNLGPIPDTLTADQRAVVESLHGQMVVVAGPGAGKTKTLVERTLNTIRHGSHPRDLLVVTFTRKAAREVRERLSVELGEHVAEQATISTFHGLAGQILRADGFRIDLNPTFETLDGSERKRLINDLRKQYNLSKDVDYQQLISSAKRNPELSSTEERARYLIGEGEHDAAEMLKAYEQEKRRLNRLDFDDMILIAHHLLKDPTVQQNWCKRFQHVQVDEYQDTDAMQDEIVRMVASGSQSLMVVGDLDQSVYSWRGSDPRLFATFASHFENATVMYLDDNFRSTPQILDVARKTIEPVEVPYRSKLTPNKPADQGTRPELVVAHDQEAEAEFVSNWVQDLLNKGVEPEEIAVLYRGHRQNLRLQAALHKKRIAANLSGGVGFFDRKTVKDILAWFRLAVKPDELAFLAIANQMPNLGPKTAQDHLDAAVTEADGDIVAYLESYVDNMTAIGKGNQKRVQSIREIMENIKGIRNVLDGSGITEAISYAARCIPEDVLTKDEVSADDFTDIVSVLVGEAREFVPDDPLPLDDANEVYHYAYGPGIMIADEDEDLVLVQFTNTEHEVKFPATLTPKAEGNGEQLPVAAQVLALDTDLQDTPLTPPVEFLQHVSVDNQALTEEMGGAIDLSTIHAAKGREWDHVAVIGLVDGRFPSGFSDEGLVEPSDEERRVMFVAVSRARKELLMTTFRSQRLKDGGFMPTKPSIFAYELAESGLCEVSGRMPARPRRNRRSFYGRGPIGTW